MKLSELLSKPFKVKGGGTVNLKELSKHVIDKEIGEEDGSESIFNKIFNLSIIPYSSKVVFNDTVVDLPDAPDGKTYYLLYKESDFNDNDNKVIIDFVYKYAPDFDLNSSPSILNRYEIDGESYVTFMGQA